MAEARISISILIPMRNECAFVARCLDSVLSQIEGRQDVEVLCIDGASDDGTREIVLDYQARDPRICLVDNPKKIVPTGMNLGIAKSKGDIIIRLDCHSEYASDYIAKCVEVLQRSGADNVGGYITTRSGKDSRVGRAIAAATSSRFGVGGSTFRIGGDERDVDTVPFGCFRRVVFDRYGLYDERLVRNQDIELNSRIRKGGGRIVISPDIRLTYFNQSTFRGIRRQSFHNGLWNPYTAFHASGCLSPRHFVPLIFALSLLLLGLGGLVWTPLWIALAAEFVLYLVVGSVMSWKAGRKTGASFWLVLATFPQMHLAYGIGSLYGVILVSLGIVPTKG